MQNAPATASLPDDVVLEILVRMKDAAALFRCATACKRWRRLVGDTSFLHSCWLKDMCASIAGFFTTEQHDGQGPCFIRAPGSAMGSGIHALSAFLRPAAPGGQILDGAKPLVSRHGLLLVRLARHVNGVNPGIIHLGVCNLINGEFHELPPLKCGTHVDKWSGYTILSGGDYKSHQPPWSLTSGNSLSFKVVIIDTALGYRLHMFSSGNASWGTPTKCFSGPNTRHYVPIWQRAAVVCRGTAHWLFYNLAMSFFYTVDMDAETGRVSSTKIPLEIDYPTFCKTVHLDLTLTTDGSLSLIYIQNDWPKITIGKIVDGTAEWICTRIIDQRKPGETLNPEISSIYMLGEKYGTLVIKDNSGTTRKMVFNDRICGR